MKKIGMIRGVAWPSTLDYYRLICTKTNEHFMAQGASASYPTPPMVIESLNINETRKLRGVEGDDASWHRYDCVFQDALKCLAQAGAEIGVIASNTPHMRLPSILHGAALPLVSILDTTAATARDVGGQRALILGTPVTMFSLSLRGCSGSAWFRSAAEARRRSHRCAGAIDRRGPLSGSVRLRSRSDHGRQCECRGMILRTS